MIPEPFVLSEPVSVIFSPGTVGFPFDGLFTFEIVGFVLSIFILPADVNSVLFPALSSAIIYISLFLSALHVPDTAVLLSVFQSFFKVAEDAFEYE